MSIQHSVHYKAGEGMLDQPHDLILMYSYVLVKAFMSLSLFCQLYNNHANYTQNDLNIKDLCMHVCKYMHVKWQGEVELYHMYIHK